MGLPQAFFPALQPSGLGSRKEDGLPFILEPEEKVVRYTLLYAPVIRSIRDLSIDPWKGCRVRSARSGHFVTPAPF